jgi:DNA adenine methylase
VNSIIRYFGGKGTMFNEIIKYFPERGSYDTYIEPFGGSYSIGLKMSYIPPVEIYNDLDKNVYSLYKVLQDENLFNEFKQRCDLMIYNEDMRQEYREKLKDSDLSILDRAFMYFYVNRTSHNGIGGFSINTLIRRGMSKSISDTLSCIDRLPELHERISHMIVCNRNGIDLVNKYNTPNVFIYCDPPYMQCTRTSSRYPVDMDDKTQMEFLTAVVNSQAKILISGYDNPVYQESLKDFTKIEFKVNTIDGKGKPKTKTECLWKNF